MLRGSTPQPSSLGTLNDDTTAVVDVDLVVVTAVKLVVGNPEPVVLDVGTGRSSQVEESESANAFGVSGSLNAGVLAAFVGLKLSSSRATNAEVDIPHTSRALALTSNVELHENSTRLRTKSLKDNVLDLDVANITGLANTENRLGVLLVLEGRVATSHDQRPNLTDDLDILGDVDGVSDDVSTVVEVDNLVTRNAVEDGLESFSIISSTVTLGTLGLDRDKAGSRNVVVLGLALGDNLASTVEERSRLVDRGLSTLDSLAVATLVGATLYPVLDNSVTVENGGLVLGVLDGNGGAFAEVNIVDDETAGGAVLSSRVLSGDTDSSVGDDTVLDNNRANVAAIVGHVNTNISAINVQATEVPEPIPVHEDGGLAAVELEVTGSELLAAQEGTNSTTVEGEVGHETTRAVVHEDTLLLVVVALVLDHVELDVLERGSLGNLPVNTSASSLRLSSEVNLEVANLAEEVVLVGVPVVASVVVGVGVDDGNAGKVGSRLDGRNVDSITNKLSVVVLDDGLGNKVGTRGEVDKSRRGSTGVTALATATTVSDGAVDSIGIISSAVTSGAVILYVAEDLEVVAAVSNGTLALNVGEPPARVSADFVGASLEALLRGSGGRVDELERQKSGREQFGKHVGLPVDSN